MRNIYPYQIYATYEYENQTIVTAGLRRKAWEIAADPILRAKLYCGFQGRGTEWRYFCRPGSGPFFSNLWKYSILGMLIDNIPLTVCNSILALLSFIFGIFGE